MKTENKNMTVKKKSSIDEHNEHNWGISELEDRLKGFSQNISQKGKKIIRQKLILGKSYGH